MARVRRERSSRHRRRPDLIMDADSVPRSQQPAELVKVGGCHRMKSMRYHFELLRRKTNEPWPAANNSGKD
jgi:hypothetical protein